MFPDLAIHFGENLADQEKGRFPKKLKSLIEVLYVLQVKVQVLIFNMNFSLLRSVFLDQFTNFGKNLGDQVKDRPPKKLKSLIEVPYVALLKVQFPGFNMNLFSSPQCDPSPSSPLRENFGDQVKGCSQKKNKIVDRASLSSAPESTSSKLQYETCLFSVACS